MLAGIHSERFFKFQLKRKNRERNGLSKKITIRNRRDIEPARPGDGGDSWDRLQISPNEFGSMPFGDGIVAIYEHSNNNKPSFNGTKRYYYAPIALLNHDSAYTLFNNITKRAEMHFKIAMWDSNVESFIVRYLLIQDCFGT